MRRRTGVWGAPLLSTKPKHSFFAWRHGSRPDDRAVGVWFQDGAERVLTESDVRAILGAYSAGVPMYVTGTHTGRVEVVK